MAGYLQQKQLHTVAPHRAALLTYPGNLREALRQSVEDPKKVLFGTGSGIPSTFLIKVIASAKPDFIWIDVEHGMFNRLELHDAIHAAQFHSEGHSMVIVRVPKHDEISLTTALDAGASGIVIPHTESAQEVRDFMKEAFYPPIGHRSFSPWTFTPGVSDASLYPDDPFNIQTSNNHVAIIPQIESVKGVENVDEIAAVEGVSGMLFGPGDFMTDAGIPLSLGVPDPRLIDAMGKFVAAGKKHRKALMAGALQLEQIPMMLEQGYTGIVVFMDVWGVAQTVKGNLGKARDYLAETSIPNGKVLQVNGGNEEEATSEILNGGTALK